MPKYSDHLGFYLYDNQPFLMREDALNIMLSKKDYAGTIQFYYNDHIFSKLNWQKDIPLSLSQLYKMRAQQLRDKYKYLILRYSGGSDSTQVLESFLSNGIFLDEIITVNHQKAINNLDRNMMVNDSNLSEYLEYEYAVIPKLNRVKSLSPNTKITVLDSSDNLVDQLANKKYFHLGQNETPTAMRTVATSMSKNWTPMLLRHEQETSTRDGVAIIRGIEKPSIHIKEDSSVWFCFHDITLTATVDMQKKGTSYTIEDFYWSPDFPIIPMKQCHVIIDKLANNKKLYSEWKTLKNSIEMAHTDPKYKGSPGYILDRWYNTIIYPDWSPTTYVAPKPTTVNSDFKLLDTLGIKHHSQHFANEYASYKLSKYDKIENKKLLNKHISSIPYYLGKFQPNF